jgi:hypothetical protein
MARPREIDFGLELLANVTEKALQGWLIWLDKDNDLGPLRPTFAAP